MRSAPHQCEHIGVNFDMSASRDLRLIGASSSKPSHAAADAGPLRSDACESANFLRPESNLRKLLPSCQLVRQAGGRLHVLLELMPWISTRRRWAERLRRPPTKSRGKVIGRWHDCWHDHSRVSRISTTALGQAMHPMPKKVTDHFTYLPRRQTRTCCTCCRMQLRHCACNRSGRSAVPNPD